MLPVPHWGLTPLRPASSARLGEMASAALDGRWRGPVPPSTAAGAIFGRPRRPQARTSAAFDGRAAGTRGRSWPPSTAASAGLSRSTDAGADLGNLRRALGRGGGSWESWPPLGWAGVGHESGLSHAAASVTCHARILCSNLKIESPTSLLASLQPRANITRVLDTLKVQFYVLSYSTGYASRSTPGNCFIKARQLRAFGKNARPPGSRQLAGSYGSIPAKACAHSQMFRDTT